MKNYYQILGVSFDAEYAEIKKKYRKLSKKYHPDISKEKNAEQKFKEITKAYEVLSSEESRAKYDQKLKQQSRQYRKSAKQNKKKSKSQSNFSQGDFDKFEERFKDYFGFDPETKEKIKEEEEESEGLNTDDLFNSFFGVGKK